MGIFNKIKNAVTGKEELSEAEINEFDDLTRRALVRACKDFQAAINEYDLPEVADKLEILVSSNNCN